MQYRKDRFGNDISILGYGCMRFSSGPGGINMDKAEKEILEAYNAGVNYYDTAYIYPGSEVALGEILHKNGIREKVKIATKLPHYMLKTPEMLEKYFQEQLKRLQTNYIDFYLMHMLTDVKTWDRLKSMGIVEWLEEKKKAGAIKQIGFSYHGNSEMFLKLLDAYDWDFCQIQYNYMDENSQAGRVGLMKAYEKGIPVIIMEPLRGGKLVNNLPAEAQRLIQEHPKKRSAAEWAFRWLWNQEQVTCVLSGMNSMEMVQENVRVASESVAGEFSEDDQELLRKVSAAINSRMHVPCTACRYCMPCPKNVDIPGVFAAWNRQASEGKFSALKEYFMCSGVRKDYTGPANCIGCGKCEQHCPQKIQIRTELKKAQRALEGPIYKMGKLVLPLVMKL